VSQLVLIFLGVFAVWKLTWMLQDYDGPLDIIKRFRETTNKLQKRAGRKLLNFECFFCLSTVVAIPLAFYLADGWDILVYWFGIAGVAWFVNVANERLA